MKNLIFVSILLLNLSILAQSNDTTYTIEVFFSGSPAFSFFRDPKTPTDLTRKSIGSAFFFRAMWHPGRMLSVGFLTGYVMLAKDEFEEQSTISGKIPTAKLFALPIQFAVSMQRLDTEFGLGIGPYQVKTELDAGFGETSEGNRFEYGITFWGSYSFDLVDKIKISPELKFLYLGYRGIFSIMPSLSLKYILYGY